MRIDKIKSLDPKRVIILDTETTGLHADGTDEILSLSIVDLEGTVLFDELVKPEHRKRWPKAQEVNGITPAMVKDKKPLSDYREQLQELWKRIDLVVGYNIPFDSDFIYSSSLNLSPYVEEFDVMREFAPIWGHWDEYHDDYRWAKLRTCARHYKIGGYDAHSSLGDAEATRRCFIALINDPEYISSAHCMEALLDGKLSRDTSDKASEQPLTSAGKPDTIDIVLSFLMVAMLFLALANLFVEWQMSVSCIFFGILFASIKAYRDARNNAK